MEETSQELHGLGNAVSDLVGVTNDLVDTISRSKWLPEKLLDLTARAVLVRQHEGLQSMLLLMRHERGYAAVPLLRPACDELIWLRYLHTLPIEDANRLLNLRANQEMGRSIAAQQQFAGSKDMRGLGFGKAFVRHSNRVLRLVEAEMVALSHTYGWDIRTTGTVERSDGPGTPFMARATKTEPLYNFLFSATSRSVHFSLSELLRRAWGAPGGEVSITSAHFTNYWSRFCLYWGSYLFIGTLAEAVPLIEGDIDEVLPEDRYMKAVEAIGNHGKVPAITVDELATADRTSFL